ncbi:unnamed protein product [Paramecium pentaurelia]|uniref:Cyclic nucleotide-binding domain-containing protein n=1 Tax=Paramecium pentaurelia TaxID=43138 RepID=A0A8S1Y2N1_9CILI|nr:unnamed protein product [Paramecium pentaurelia]
MSSDIFIEFEQSYNVDQHQGCQNNSHIEDSNRKGSGGPARFTIKIDPFEEGDTPIQAPSIGSQIIENPLSSRQEKASELQKLQISPHDLVIEENPLVLTSKLEINRESNDSKLQNQTAQINGSQQINNFLKLVIAKSSFNRFVDNLLQKSYVKKSHHFSDYQKSLMDDLRYLYQHKRVKKNWLQNICKRLKFFPILDQSSNLVIGWQILHILTTIIVFFWTPFNISFGVTYQQIVFGEMTVKSVEKCFLFSILIDSLIVINTSFIEKGVIIRSRRKIFINYLNSQGIYDMLSFIALLVGIENEIDRSHDKLGWQICPYLIFYCSRQFKLQDRVRKLEEFFNFTGLYQDFIELIKLLFMVIYVGHLFACLWHGVAFYQQGHRQTWIDTYVQDDEMFQKYNYAIYWAVQTMITVGYGDLTPQNQAERVCANFSMFLACGVFAFSFNSIGLMLTNLNSRQVLYKKSVNLLNQYLIKNQIKIELQQRIRNYYDYIFAEEQEINDEEVSQIKSKLSNSLLEELNFEIRHNVMRMNTLLAKFSQKTLKLLSLVIEEVRYSPEDQIIIQDTCDDAAMYMITKGTICIQFQDINEGSNCREFSYLSKGDSFGEYAFFTGMPRTASAKSVGFSRAYKISRIQLLNVLAQCPLDMERFCEVRDSILESNNYQPAKLSCYSCNKFTHLIKDCPVLHYVADQEKILKKANYPFLQERNYKYQRKKLCRKKYHTLKESKQNLNIVKEFQSNYAFDNVSCIDEELEDSQSELAVSPQEYSSQTKSLSKLSRQQSQNRSLSQDNHLQPIQESDSSKDSGGLQNPRVKQTKQTIQTAGFCVTDSIHNKLASIKEEQLTDSLQDRQQQSSVNISISNLQKYEDFKFSLKNDQHLLTNNDNQRQSNQKTGLTKKLKKDDSLKHIQSQTQLDVRDRGQSLSNQIRKSRLSKDIREISQEFQFVDKRDVFKRKNSKTNLTKTTKTLKTLKIQDNPSQTQNQELSAPIFDTSCPSQSMELENFEQMKNFQYYFSWNNPSVVVPRALRILKMNIDKRRNFGNNFSLYTFNNLAMNKALRIKRKLKLIDDPIFDDINTKKSRYGNKIPRQTRIGNKRNTQQSDIIGLHLEKPSHITEISIQKSNFYELKNN